MFAVGLLVTPSFYRVSRAAALSIANTDYIEQQGCLAHPHAQYSCAMCLPKVAPSVAVITAFGDRHVPVGCCVADIPRHWRRAA